MIKNLKPETWLSIHRLLDAYVCEIFKNEDLALELSKKAREHALKTHNMDENMRRLIEIYEEIEGKRG